MYCPNCGWQNATGTRFCKQCGANLGVVSEALSGKLQQPPNSDAVVKLIREFHSGRRKAVQGVTLIGGGFMIMTLLMFVGMNPMGAFWIVFWMYIWGIIELAIGFSKWVGSSGEMNALGFTASRAIPAKEKENVGALEPDRSTGPVGMPASVTEQTTRKLEEKVDTE